MQKNILVAKTLVTDNSYIIFVQMLLTCKVVFKRAAISGEKYGFGVQRPLDSSKILIKLLDV